MRIDAGSRAEEKAKRYRLAVQQNRGAVYTLAGILAMASWAIGTITAHALEIIGVIGAAYLSVLIFGFLSQLDLSNRTGRFLDWCWMLADAALISWGVVITGGSASPWFPWYLANVSGAAFVANTRTALGVMVLDILGYLGALYYCGDITGIDRSILVPLTRLLFLFGASFFFLRGISTLRHKRAQIRRMRDEARNRVEELTRLTAALDQRTRELGEANIRIREADRAKSQFLANMSHELRTPLNSIIGFSEILLTRLEDSLDERYLKFLSNINESGRHLLGIINDVLDLSKIEAGKIELDMEKISLEETIEGVCRIMKSQASKRGIRFEVSCEPDLPPLEGDPVRVKQILYNLLSNAVKFSHDKGSIEIEARTLSGEASPLKTPTISVAVRDHGIGIEPSKHGKIFEEFEQADGTTTRYYGGTGLGLALVRRFVQLHGGTISVDSTPGLGSTFTVFFPREPSGTVQPVDSFTPRVQLEGSTRRRVLVVEDDPTAFETLAAGLSERSWLPVRARNAEEALRLVKVVRPSVILLDIVLPGMDGWALLHELKSQPDCRDIPVIVVSLLDNRELGLALGAVDYFVKPVAVDQLVDRLVELVPPEPRGMATVLLIDDDPQLHELLEARMEHLPLTLHHAMSGAEGVRMAEELRPALIILDLMMEGMDGFAVAAELRNHPETRDIPIIVHTQKELTRDDVNLLKGRVDAMIAKGSHGNEELQETVDRILGWAEGRGRR